jgi:hypothetical protein
MTAFVVDLRPYDNYSIVVSDHGTKSTDKYTLYMDHFSRYVSFNDTTLLVHMKSTMYASFFQAY